MATCIDYSTSPPTQFTWSGGGGGASISSALLSLPYASKRHAAIVTDAAITPSSKLILSLGAMPNTEVNADDDIDLLAIQGIAGAGSFQVLLNFLTPIGGNLRINYMAA